jgi:hypothetical protein
MDKYYNLIPMKKEQKNFVYQPRQRFVHDTHSRTPKCQSDRKQIRRLYCVKNQKHSNVSVNMPAGLY